MRRLALLGLVPALTACGLSLHQLPAPGGVSGPTYHLTAVFRDVSDLTVGAKVKLQGVVVGEVTSIRTADFTAHVSMSISKRFRLPAGTTFQVRFTTPLGEDFVLATPPPSGGQQLRDGDTVAPAQTSEAPTIEDTFAALSLLLNGGGLDKLHTIVAELDTALKGRTGAARDTLRRLDVVVGHLDAHKSDIDAALTGLAALSKRLDAGSTLVTQALGQFPQTLRILAADTGRIRVLLAKVATLGSTVQELLRRGQRDLLADLDALRPTLDAVAASRRDLQPTFDSLIGFGRLIDRATPGDYLNLSVTVQLLYDAPPQRPQPPAPTSADAISTLLTGGLR